MESDSFPIAPMLGAAEASSPSRGEIPPPPEVETAAVLEENRFGRYIRVSRLRQGGMGEVWKASELHRWVALKFPRFENADELDRLRREARAAARLGEDSFYDFACLGALYAESGNRDEAVRCLTRALEIEPGSSEVRELLERIRQCPP